MTVNTFNYLKVMRKTEKEVHTKALPQSKAPQTKEEKVEMAEVS